LALSLIPINSAQENAAVPVTSCAIGITAAFWFIERLAGFAS
jgi:hypothetical protein